MQRRKGYHQRIHRRHSVKGMVFPAGQGGNKLPDWEKEKIREARKIRKNFTVTPEMIKRAEEVRKYKEKQKQTEKLLKMADEIRESKPKEEERYNGWANWDTWETYITLESDEQTNRWLDSWAKNFQLKKNSGTFNYAKAELVVEKYLIPVARGKERAGNKIGYGGDLNIDPRKVNKREIVDSLLERDVGVEKVGHSKDNFTIDDAIKINKDKGQHFFDDDNMKFSNSKIETGFYNQKYFLTSEKQPTDFDGTTHQRLYSIREFDRDSGRVKTIGEFQQYNSRDKAIRAIKKLSGE